MKDFHTVCIDCRGVDCDFDHRCMECTDIDNSTMTEYVHHKLTLRRKLLSKRKLKELKLANVAVVADDLAPDEAISSDALLSVEPPLTVDSLSVSDPDLDFCVDEKLNYAS